MDLNVSLDAAARARKSEAAVATTAMAGMSNGDGGDAHHHHQQQQQRKRKANRDSWPFMHAIMLLECFKEVWTKSNMGNLTMAQWTEVSNKVNEFCGINMNEQQCRTKVDNLKKRYKRERMKYGATGHTSPWEFYGVMNKLFGNTTKLSAAGASPVSGQPGAGDDTEGSDEDDVVVLDNGGDLIFNISSARDIGGLTSTSPQPASGLVHSSFARGHNLLLEGAGESALDTSPNENSNVGLGQAADANNFQDPGFSNAPAISPRLGSAKRMGRTSKRKRDSMGTVPAEGYGELLKEVEKERNADWQRRWVELAKVDKKRAKSFLRAHEAGRNASDGVRNASSFFERPMDVGAYAGGLADRSGQADANELDDAIEEERRRDEAKMKALWEAEQKVELAAKALTDAQDEKERLEGDLRVSRETLDHRKALARALKLSFKKAFIEKTIPAESINVSLSKFPYHLSDVTRDLLVEAVAPCLNQSKRPSQLAGICSSSHMILLNGPQNTEIYQETLVKALSHDQGVGLLVLESTDLAPQDYGDGEDSETDAPAASGDTVDYEILKKVGTSKSLYSVLRKGDRVVYRGSRSSARDDRSRLELLRRGRVAAVSQNGSGKIGILFDKYLTAVEDALKLTSRFEEVRRTDAPIEWHYASDFEKDQSWNTAFTGEWHAALSALCEIGKSAKPFVVYFPDAEQWFQRAVPVAWKHEFVDHVQKQLDKLNGNVVFVASFTSNGDDPLKGLSKWRKQRLKSIYGLFPNVVDIFPPKDDLEFWRWKMQLLQDSQRITANRNIQLLQKIMSFHNVTCMELLNSQICDFTLTQLEAESLAGWAINYEYASSRNPHFDRTNNKLSISAGSLDRALLKLRRLKHSQGYKGVANDEYEEAVLSAVVPPDGGPKFEDVGALDDVKKVLGEIVVLPLLRPELFTKGALACPCKGVLLYGPPGTGKTLLAKAVATESSANLIWLRGSAIDYKWLEDPKSMTRAVFAIAKRLAPSIIFLDEIDSIFGIQGGEAMNRFKFEFLSGWDKFMSRMGEQVMVLAATYRPFDLDEAVIHKFHRRLCMGLPDAPSREKILHVLLAKEDVENGFHCKALLELTDGYSGSDLKNLTVAAAYRPVREMLELEKSKGNSFGQEPLPQELRPLTIQDLVSAMEEVVANMSYNTAYLDQLRHWDEQYGIRRW